MEVQNRDVAYLRSHSFLGPTVLLLLHQLDSDDYFCFCRVPGALWVSCFSETCKSERPYLKWNGMWKPLLRPIWQSSFGGEGPGESYFHFIPAFLLEEPWICPFQMRWLSLMHSHLTIHSLLFWSPAMCQAQCSLLRDRIASQMDGDAGPSWVYVLNIGGRW